MTHVTDEQLGKLARQQADLFRRVREDSIDVNYASSCVQRIIEQKLPAHESTVFTLEVNYDQSVEAALKAGKYAWPSEHITSQNFPPTRRGTDVVQLHLVHFHKEIRFNGVIGELDKQGLRPATIEELLAFGANPGTQDLQRQFSILATGSFWYDSHYNRQVPFLGGVKRSRSVNLSCPGSGYGWTPNVRFLAVSK